MTTKNGSMISRRRPGAEFIEKKLNTRGRRREARWWLAEEDRRRRAIVRGDGPRLFDPDRFGRTVFQRCDAATRAGEQWTEELKARDPALHATIMELMWEDARKYLAMTDEQRRAKVQAQLDRGVEKLRRDKRREETS